MEVRKVKGNKGKESFKEKRMNVNLAENIWVCVEFYYFLVV